MTPEEKKSNLFEDEDLISPYVMPSNVSKAMAKYGDALDAIGNQLSKQNVILTRSLGNLRRIEQGLTDTEFLLGEIGENYQEALDDFKTEEKKKAARKKFVTKLISPFKKRETPQQATNQSPGKPKEDKPWWNLWDGSKQTQQKLASGGISSTGTGENNILQPGIYDNPTQGNLAPGTAVVPLNRNYGKDILGQYDQQQYEQALGKVLFKPTSALLGGAVSVYGSILRGLGPLAGYFNSSIPGILSTVSSILGVSRSAVINLFGGPAYAGVTPNTRDTKSFYKSWKSYMDKNNLYFPGGINAPSAPAGGAGEGQDTGGPEVEWMGGLDARTASSFNPFGDNDGQETGIDISLRGKGTNGYGRGLTIRNPWDNLYYFSKVPKGFDKAGEPTRGIQGSAERNKVRGFGHWATYYIKDSDGSWYELMIGHLDKAAPTWNDTGSGVKLNKGVKIGVQGASGSSIGNTPDGTYDHMTTHINSGGKNRQRAGQLLLQWASDLDSYKPPIQPPVARLQAGGWIKPMANLLSGITKPKGLSIRGVQAGFTGMAREGFNAIMSGDKFRLPAAKSLMGRGSQPVLGRGAYSAPTIKGAERYQKPGGGIVKTIVPSGARRVSIIEPQAVVKPSTFDKGKVLADKLLAGQYANSPLANKLRGQLLSGVAQNVGIGFAKTFGKAIGILNAPVISDMLFPEPTAAGTLDYARSQGWITPETSKPIIKTRTIELPSTPSVAPSQASAATPQFVNLDIPTNTVLTTTQMRRL
jgi:hypothetical protein